MQQQPNTLHILKASIHLTQNSKELYDYKPHATKASSCGVAIAPVQQTHKQCEHKEELETTHGVNSLACLKLI